MAENPAISVIVPVYNAEKWLHRCVDSILAQTFTDFELLLIDDGSTDRSGAICDEYATRDPRIRVFHQPNGGVSSARNLGLDNARGEWITFVDADDWISKSYLINLIDNSNDTNLVFNYATRHENGIISIEKYPEQYINIIDLQIPLLYNDLIWHTSPWGKLFNKNLILKLNIRFPLDMHIGEDAVFLFSYIFNCTYIKFICTCDYHYRIDRAESLTRRLNSFESEWNGFLKIKNIADKLRIYCNSNPELNEKCDWLSGSYLRRSLNAVYHDNKNRKERIGFLASTDFIPYIKGVKENSLQGKIYQFLLRHEMIRTYDFIRNNLIKIFK